MTNYMLNKLTDDIDRMVKEFNAYADSENFIDCVDHLTQSVIDCHSAISQMNLIQMVYHDNPNLIDAMSVEAHRALLILKDIKNILKDDSENMNRFDKLYRDVRNSTVAYIRFCLQAGDRIIIEKRKDLSDEKIRQYEVWADEIRGLWNPDFVDPEEKNFSYAMKKSA